MPFDETDRYDSETELSAKPQVITVTAADLAKNAGETMGPAPEPKRRNGKSANMSKSAKVGKPASQYAVLDLTNKTFRYVEDADLKTTAREIEGDTDKRLVRMIPQSVTISVEISE